MNHYYCKSEFDIGLRCKDLELVLSKIDKTNNEILILSQEHYSQKNLIIILTNTINIDEEHKIELLGIYPKFDDDPLFEKYDYEIKFRLPGKYFKKMIIDIKSFSDVVSICQEDRDSSLKFEYMTFNKKIESKNIVNDNTSISYETTLKPDDSLRIAFNVDNVKPIASSTLSEYVDIFCNENKPILFYLENDNGAFKAKILSNIIDDRVL